VHLLRVETGAGEVTIETGTLSREAVLRLPGRLVALQQAHDAAAALQGIFSTGSAPRTPTPAAGKRAAPAPSPRSALSATPAH
jgi:hypothetical protein